jgi:hypothetical protein
MLADPLTTYPTPIKDIVKRGGKRANMTSRVGRLIDTRVQIVLRGSRYRRARRRKRTVNART